MRNPMDGMDDNDLLRAEQFNNYRWCPDRRGDRARHRELGLVHVADNQDGHRPICTPLKDIAGEIDPTSLKDLLP